MKILHVINSLAAGGAEKLVADLAPLQRERGHDVGVLLLRGGNTPFRTALEERGIRVRDFGAGTSVYSPLHVFRLMPFLRKCDVVHVHLFPAQYWVAFAKMLSGAKTRLITTEHSTSNRRRGIPCFRFFDKFVYGRYTKIVGISTGTTDALKRYLGQGGAAFATIPNGADIGKIRGAAALPAHELVPVSCRTLVMQVAGFRDAKNQDAVIRALALLPESVHAVFVGDGARREICERLAEKLGLRSRAHFLGVRADVPALLNAADIVVMSSHWEGFGLAAVEGMAAGKPVVASDVPGLAEVVGGAGILFPQGDEKALASAILRLAEDENLYAETAAACSRRALDFDIRETCDAYLKIYGTKK